MGTLLYREMTPEPVFHGEVRCALADYRRDRLPLAPTHQPPRRRRSASSGLSRVAFHP